MAACASDAATLLAAATSCTDAGVPDGGPYTYRVVAVYRSWSATGVGAGTVTVVTPTQVAFTTQPSAVVAGAAISPAVAVTVRDAANAAVPVAGISVTVSFGTNAGGGTLSGTLTAATNAGGVATFTGLSVDKAAAGYTLAAASAGLSGATSSAFTVSAAAGSTFAITSSPVSGTASATATLGPLTVARRDAFGNASPAPGGGTAVTLASNSTGTAVFAATSGGASVGTVTIPAGSSSVTFWYGDTKAGTPTITASGSLTSATQSATVTAGAATKLAFAQQPTNTAQSATITPSITAQVQDTFGNLTASTATVTIAIQNNAGTLGLGQLNGTLSHAAVAGLATFGGLTITGPLSLPLAGAGNGYTLKVTSAGLTQAVSAAFNIT